MMFSEIDQHFMGLALDEARAALASGDFPVGAVLTVNNELFGRGRNGLFSKGETTAHAEHSLISGQSAALRALLREQPIPVTCLYTTLEPCLMCLGISVMHRIGRIVVACPDPFGGVMSLDAAQLPALYQKWWPTVKTGLFKEQSCELILSFLKTGKLTSSERMMVEFQTLQNSWQTG